MRATVELHENSKEGLPPVKAKVTLGKEDLSIKVKHTHTHIKLLYVCLVCVTDFTPTNLSSDQ